MADIKTHEEDCLRLLGNKYNHVHRWLDQYTKIYPIETHLEYHRKFLHNHDGVVKIGNLFENDCVLAAKIHLLRDFDVYLKIPFIDIKDLEDVERLYIDLCKTMEKWNTR